MKGVIKIKEDKSWVIEYQVWDDDKSYELPLLPESGLTIRVIPNLEVEFKEVTKDGKVYAKLLPEKNNRYKSSSRFFKKIAEFCNIDNTLSKDEIIEKIIEKAPFLQKNRHIQNIDILWNIYQKNDYFWYI